MGNCNDIQYFHAMTVDMSDWAFLDKKTQIYLKENNIAKDTFHESRGPYMMIFFLPEHEELLLTLIRGQTKYGYVYRRPKDYTLDVEILKTFRPWNQIK